MYHINDIEKYKGHSLKVAEENLNDLDEGEFYYHEITGLEVYEGDNLIGTIKEILQPGANDVWGSQTQRETRPALTIHPTGCA